MYERGVELLKNSVKKACNGSEVGIMFSGGLDSTIIAMLANKFTKVTAYTSGFKDSPDLKYANMLKEYLDFEVKAKEFSIKDLKKSLYKIISVLDETNPVKVSVEIPLYFSAKSASQDDLDLMLCGQGADELFGGFYRYLNILKKGKKAFKKALEQDVEKIWSEQLKKDSLVCTVNNIDLKFPYMDSKVQKYAMNLPIKSKIHNSSEFSCFDNLDGKNYIRKYALRKIGEKIGVPKVVLNRGKKAALYGSRAWRIIKKLAKDQNYKEKAKEAGREHYIEMYLENLL